MTRVTSFDRPRAEFPWIALAWLLTSVVLSSSPLVGQDSPGGQSARPDLDAIVAARARIDRVYRETIRGLRDTEGRREFAAKLLELAARTERAADRLALLTIAAEEATAGKDASLLLAIGEQAEGLLATRRTKWVLRWLLEVAKLRLSRDERIDCANSLMLLATDSATALDWGLAKRAIRAAKSLAQLSPPMPSLLRSFSEREHEFLGMRDLSQAVAGARTRLRLHPKDRRARQNVGLYECVVRKDWGKALPLLKGAEAQLLGDAARKDNAAERAEDEVKKQVEAGHAWRACAVHASELVGVRRAVLRARRIFAERSLYWYETALPDLDGTGFAKEEVEYYIQRLRAGNYRSKPRARKVEQQEIAYGTELLRNPSAEDAVRESTPRWRSTKRYWHARRELPEPYDGKFYFSPTRNGCKNKLATLRQTVDLSTYKAAIDTGTLKLKLRGAVRTARRGGPDTAQLALHFLDYRHVRFRAGKVESPQTVSRNNWRVLELETVIPRGARSVVVRMIARRRGRGRENNAYFDGLSLTLAKH